MFIYIVIHAIMCLDVCFCLTLHILIFAAQTQTSKLYTIKFQTQTPKTAEQHQQELKI